VIEFGCAGVFDIAIGAKTKRQHAIRYFLGFIISSVFLCVSSAFSASLRLPRAALSETAETQRTQRKRREF